MVRRLKAYLKRAVRYIVTGTPEVYVKVNSVYCGRTLEGKNIVITGASSGIGYETAKKMLI